MKFQDEGPKLRQQFHYHKSLAKVVDDGAPRSSENDIVARSNNSDGEHLNEARSSQDPERCQTDEIVNYDLVASVYSPVMQQQQLLDSFTWSMCASHQIDLSPALGTYRRWLPHLFPLSGTNFLLDQSVRACTLAHLARLHHSDVLLRESQNHYGKALRLLNHDLQDSSKGMANETLSATMLLSVFEMFTSDSNLSWIRHAGGVSTLMKIRGPSRHRTGIGRDMFLAYRTTLIIQASQSEERTFLNEPEWRQLSHKIYEDIHRSGVFGDRVESDIFEGYELLFLEAVSLCSLTCDVNDLSRLGQATDVDHTQVLEKLTTSVSICRDNFKSIYSRLRAALKAAGHEPTSQISGDPVFPVQSIYVNIFVGALHIRLWSALMQANMLLMRLDHSPQQTSLYRMETKQLARECCQSVSYLATSSFLGPFLVINALRISLLALEDPDQRSWIIGKLFELGSTRLSMAKHLPSTSIINLA